MFFSKAVIASTFALATLAFPLPSPPSFTSRLSSSTSLASNSTSSSGGGSGSVNIVNSLNQTVYLWSTSSTSGSSSMQALAAGGGSYTENWKTTSDGSGISIKMSTAQDQASVLQFEYTAADDVLYWDFSCIDLDSNSAFVTGGFSATPADSSCSAVTCAAGDTDCAEAYQQSDDEDTNSCSSSTQFVVKLGL